MPARHRQPAAKGHLAQVSAGPQGRTPATHTSPVGGRGPCRVRPSKARGNTREVATWKRGSQETAGLGGWGEGAA